MLRFFRSIRRSLISEGKTVKYIKYAVGEFLLIVAGILVALQIQNWNEGRKDAALASEYIGRLIFDIEKDVYHNTQRMEFAQLRMELSEFLINCLDDPVLAAAHPVKFILALDTVDAIYSPIYHSNTLEELKSTGNLRLLDTDLKTLLLSYYEREDLLSDISSRREYRSLRFVEIALAVLDPQHQIWIQKNTKGIMDHDQFKLIEEQSNDQIRVEDTYARFKEHDEIAAWLPAMRRQQRGIRSGCENALEQASSLLEILKSARNNSK